MAKTLIDWWAWRARGDISAHMQAWRSTFSDLPFPVTFEARKGGWMGYQNSASIRLGDIDAGLMAWGGENQRGWIYNSLSGQGCAWVLDWSRAQDAASDLAGYDVRRVDIALDTFEPCTGYEPIVSAYQSGGFTLSGRPPKASKIEPCSPYDGRTFYVGNRQNDKFFRGYEKGLQQLAPLLSKLHHEAGPDSFEFILGLPINRGVGNESKVYRTADWFRHELELKPKSGELPEDVIDRRDQYFAGAYPYLGQVLSGVDAEPLIIRRERAPQTDLSAALEVIRQQYGNTIFTALAAYHGDIGAVWSRIVGGRHNERLLRAGVLMVDHE